MINFFLNYSMVVLNPFLKYNEIWTMGLWILHKVRINDI